MSELICSCHCGGTMFYRHLHADSCPVSREGQEAPASTEQQEIRSLREQLATAQARIAELEQVAADVFLCANERLAHIEELTTQLDAAQAEIEDWRLKLQRALTP